MKDLIARRDALNLFIINSYDNDGVVLYRCGAARAELAVVRAEIAALLAKAVRS